MQESSPKGGNVALYLPGVLILRDLHSEPGRKSWKNTLTFKTIFLIKVLQAGRSGFRGYQKTALFTSDKHAIPAPWLIQKAILKIRQLTTSRHWAHVIPEFGRWFLVKDL